MKISLEEALKLLSQGEVVAIPTETVYGLAAPLSSEAAIRKIFTLKNRPQENPLIVHVKSKDECKKFIDFAVADFDKLADYFWPGPITFVLPVKPELVPEIARANLPTCAFRIPSHPVALELLQKGLPLVAPSANLSGRPSSTRVEHVENDFGKDFPVLDGGASCLGIESTIIIYRENSWQIARQGSISAEAIEKVLGYRPKLSQKSLQKPICPGELFRHYAPNCKLNLGKVYNGEDFVVGFSDRCYPQAKRVWNLGKSTDPSDAAFKLYSTLRSLDEAQIQEAFIDIDVEEKGLWLTILERLQKAAAPSS